MSIWDWQASFEVEHLTAPDTTGRRANLWRGAAKNNLTDEGERNVLDTYLRGINVPASFFLRLYNDSPTETDSLASLSGEPGFHNGYSQQQVLRSNNADGWPTLTFVGGNAQASSKQVTFDCIFAYTVSHCVMATTSDNTGLLISYASLAAAKTLASGEQLKITYRPSLS